MKQLLSSLAGAAILAVLPSIVVHAAVPGATALSVKIISLKPTTVTAKHSVVTFRLRVQGMTLDAKHIDRKNIVGHGHVQLYVDKIPSDAYRNKDLKHHWLASLAASGFQLNLSPVVLGGTGKHIIFVTLAQNDDVLYRIPTASSSITVK
jgi:hypothetical protein